MLILSAKGLLDDKVDLLKSGADDYITKPFEPEEVLARIQTTLRRLGNVSGSHKILSYRKIKLYPESRKVMMGHVELLLTTHEYDILFLLMQVPEKVYSRENLYELV